MTTENPPVGAPPAETLPSEAPRAADASPPADVQIADLQSGIGDVQQRVTALRTKVSDAAGTTKMGITLGAIGSIVVLLYLALLHWVLFRHSGEIRKQVFPD